MISATEATAFLDYFCDSAARTDHAVLIDAPWGAGKTHFIKAYLQSRDATARQIDELTGAPFLYATLYGVNTLDQVREQFFAQAYPVLSSVPIKIIGTALAGVAKKFTGAEFDKNDVKLTRLPLEARVLVFDDLERVAMPLVDALGLINSFVEHDNYKVIVIANQAEVPSDQKRDYERQREKVIGRTLTITADPTMILEKLIKEMHYTSARDAADDNSDSIVRLFEASDMQNLRSLRAAIADFDRLVGLLNPKLSNCPEALRRLLLYVVATTVEFRAGLTRAELDALMSVRISFAANTNPEAQKAQVLQAKYPEIEWRDPVIPANVLADYLVTGVLNIEAADQAILIHPLIAEPWAVPAWRRLIAWQQRGATAFKADRDEVLEALDARLIVEPGEICHIAGIALWLEQMDAPLLSNVEKDVNVYVDDVEAAGTLKPVRSMFSGGFSDSWAGFGFCCAEHPMFTRIKSHLQAAVYRTADTAMKAAAPKLMAQLRCAGNEGEALYDGQLGKGHYGGLAILHHVEVTSFADLLVSDGCVNREMAAALIRRYEYWGRDPEMMLEQPWLVALQRELNFRAEALGPPFERSLKNMWSKAFSEIFAVLKFVESQNQPAAASELS